jgi:ribosomal protein S12 methylthiotransferase
MSDEFIQTIADEPKICHYIDLPLQHISSGILKRMRRSSDSQYIVDLIGKLRKAIPDIAIRTTLIAGFPGETDAEYEELLQFVKNIEFDKLGVFCYSKEEGTPAARMKGQIAEPVKESRRDGIMTAQQAINEKIAEKLIGTGLDVLIEGVSEDGVFYIGRSYREAPDVDGCIYVASDRELVPGEIVVVDIMDHRDYDFTGITRRDT